MTGETPAQQPPLNNRSLPFLKRSRTYWGFKLGAAESKTLAKAIRRSGVSISEFIRRAALKAADDILKG